MIRNFKCRETEKIFNRNISLKLPQSIQNVVLRKLCMIDAATSLNDLKAPQANRLEALHGDRKGQYSIRINDQWRICFNWMDGNAYNLEIINYH